MDLPCGGASGGMAFPDVALIVSPTSRRFLRLGFHYAVARAIVSIRADAETDLDPDVPPCTQYTRGTIRYLTFAVY